MTFPLTSAQGTHPSPLSSVPASCEREHRDGSAEGRRTFTDRSFP